MDFNPDFLRQQAKAEMHIERLVNGGWLISVHPRTGDVFTPFMAFSNATDLVSALSGLTGADDEPFALAKMSDEQFQSLMRSYRADDASNKPEEA